MLFVEFLVGVSDSIMAFIFPLVVAVTLSSNSEMGLVMGLSSAAGFALDLLIPRIMKHDTWNKAILYTIIFSFFFPVLTFLGKEFSNIFFFICSSLVWGVYFEFLSFSQQDYVVSEEKKANISKDWSIISAMNQLTALFAPILSLTLFDVYENDVFLAVVLFQVLAFISFFLLIKNGQKNKFKYHSKIEHTITIFKEVKSFGILASKLLVILLNSVTVNVVIAFFWTLGAIYGEEIANEHIPSWVFFALYIAATIIGALALPRFKIEKRKLLFSNIFLMVSSLIFVSLILTESIFVILLIIVLGSFFLGMINPLNDSLLTEISKRNTENEIYLFSFGRFAVSLSYVIGPVLAGYLSESFGNKNSFVLIAIISSFLAIIYILFTPRVIRIPQKKLREINA